MSRPVTADQLTAAQLTAGPLTAGLATAGDTAETLLAVEWTPVPGTVPTGFEPAGPVPAGASGPVPQLVPAGAAGCGAEAARAEVGRVLGLVQEWLAGDQPAGARLAVVTRGAVAVRPGEGVTDLAGAAVWGLVRSAQSEDPGRLVLIDLPPGTSEDTGEDTGEDTAGNAAESTVAGGGARLRRTRAGDQGRAGVRKAAGPARAGGARSGADAGFAARPARRDGTGDRRDGERWAGWWPGTWRPPGGPGS